MDLTHFRTPGQLLAKLLDDRQWSQRLISVILGVNETIISKVISGHRSVDAELALLFESLFDGITADDFLELQKQYDLGKARFTAQPDPSRATRAVLFGDLPVQEMIKRGWITADDVRDVSTVEKELTRFFGVDSLNEIEVLKHAAKKTHVAIDATPAQIAWIRRVQQIANDMLVGEYSPAGVKTALLKLAALLGSPEHVRRVPRILAECGIRFVIVESIGSAKIDGVCFWLDDESPVIGMTLRFDRIDNFWFVLRHEIEHVLHLHGRTEIILDVSLEGERAGTGDNVPDEEKIANDAAANFGVTTKTLQGFINRKYPYFKEADLLGFANTMHVHPGIVAGRLQHAIDRYDLFRNHLVKIRSKIVPSAMVDGWGEIAPVDI